MRTRRWIELGLMVLVALVVGCQHEKPYGTEAQLSLPGSKSQTWAIAPAVNLSGQRVDPLLQADLVYQQLQQVHGLTVVPVNRVVEVYVSLRLENVQSQEQADLVCQLLGCDALLVPTVTAYDPYNPPKFGVALQLFLRGGAVQTDDIDPRELSRRASPPPTVALPTNGAFVQVVGMFDATNGTVRQLLMDYAKGRNDPAGPFGANEYLVSMDRYCGFAYWTMISDLLNSPRLRR
jgi:hypothetical protein